MYSKLSIRKACLRIRVIKLKRDSNEPTSRFTKCLFRGLVATPVFEREQMLHSRGSAPGGEEKNLQKEKSEWPGWVWRSYVPSLLPLLILLLLLLLLLQQVLQSSLDGLYNTQSLCCGYRSLQLCCSHLRRAGRGHLLLQHQTLVEQEQQQISCLSVPISFISCGASSPKHAQERVDISRQ